VEEADTVLVELGLVEQRYRAVLDAWVRHYNIARPHQGIGDRPPADRFALALQPQAGMGAGAAADPRAGER
jgi:Integrase core domain